MLSEEQKKQLLAAAVEAQKKAYCPYSHYAVGAAVLMEDGRIFTGCNVENAAYPSGLCAERVAIFKAVSEGCRRLMALLVLTDNGGSPCGACRQVMREFASDDMPLLIADAQGRIFESSLGALLPRSFGPEDLQTGA